MPGLWDPHSVTDMMGVSDKTTCELNRIECLAGEGDGPVGENALSLGGVPK